jgi:hypothetical protein
VAVLAWNEPSHRTNSPFSQTRLTDDSARQSTVTSMPRRVRLFTRLVAEAKPPLRDASNSSSRIKAFLCVVYNSFPTAGLKLTDIDLHGREPYVWHGRDESAPADPDLPPVSSSIDASAQTVFTLPKASVTVLCGEIKR